MPKLSHRAQLGGTVSSAPLIWYLKCERVSYIPSKDIVFLEMCIEKNIQRGKNARNVEKMCALAHNEENVV